MEHAEDYDAKARRIAQELGLSVAIHKANPQRCPDWETPRDRFTRRMQCACGNVHGYLFAVTISRDGTAGAQSADLPAVTLAVRRTR